MGKILNAGGYITSEKFIRGRTPQEIERVLGLIPNDLGQGAYVLRLNALPLPSQFELRGYSQTPAGVPYHGGPYPPGLGANQFELTVDLPATVLKFVAPGQRF